MTTRYVHTPAAIRITAAELAEHLVALADHLAARRSHELMLRLDELTDAVVAAERLAIALRVDVEVGALGREGVIA